MARQNNAIAHLYISDPTAGKSNATWFSKLFLTHPPIQDRIKALQDMSM